MVRHGENGFIYKMRDPAQLASMISKIAKDPELYDRMSEAAYRRFAFELNSKKMTAETMAFYRELYSKCAQGVSARE